MLGIPNIYAYIAGGVAVLSLIGVLKYQDYEIHKYHTEYNCVAMKLDCPKNSKDLTVPDLVAAIAAMTTTQNTQTEQTERVVTKVVQGPETVRTVIKEIHDAPEPVNCGTPELPVELKI